MTNKYRKLASGIALLLGILFVVIAGLSFTTRQWRNLALSGLALFCLTVPFVITRVANKKNILLPSSFELVTVLFIFLAQYLGELKKFYGLLWWWDLLLHALFGSYAVITGLHIIKGRLATF